MSHGTGSNLEQKRVRSPVEEEGVTEVACDELTSTLIHVLPLPFKRRTQRETSAKLSLGRRKGWEKLITF